MPYGNKEIRYFDSNKYTGKLSDYLAYFPRLLPTKVVVGGRRIAKASTHGP